MNVILWKIYLNQFKSVVKSSYELNQTFSGVDTEMGFSSLSLALLENFVLFKKTI